MKTNSAKVVLMSAILFFAVTALTAAPATGPLRVHPVNPRYFTDGTKSPEGSLKAVCLTGSHTWGNLCDSDERRPDFDFAGYLDFLERYHHNFIRLWSGDGLGHQPVPYARTGPGTAKDGGLKVDLNRFDPAFFDRLRSRVVAARDRGVYVGIMLFSPDSGAKREDWDNLLYHPTNNVQGINADTNNDGSGAEAYDLSIPRITAYQEAFARKVVDAVNDLDNVLYEIGNEGDLTSVPWQYHFIRFIKSYEAGKPEQHPVGMTAVFDIVGGTWATDNKALFDSPADWVAPGLDPYKDNPPAADGRKVIIADVDHIWPTAPHRAWIWKCFLRGIHPILMDWYSYGDPKWTSTVEQEAMRKYMGYTLTYANKMNLAAMTPRNELSSTGYCLANPGKEYLLYLPDGGEVTVDLSAAAGPLQVEWIHPVEGTTQQGGEVAGGAQRTFKTPFNGDAVLYLWGHSHPSSRGRQDKAEVDATKREAGVPANTFVRPGQDWQTATPESQGMSSRKLDALKDSLAARKTKSLLVIRNDRIVYEWYAPGHGPSQKHYTASMAKAIVGGLSLGVAVTDGRIALDDSVAKYVPQWKDDPRKLKITLRQLGSHTSGLEDAEADNLPHDRLTGWKGDFWKQLAPPCDPFTVSRDAALVLFEPSEKTQYSNPGIAMLTYCVTAALRDAPQKDIRSLLRDRVMRPIGVPDEQWSVGYGETYTVDGLPLVGAWGGGNYTARAVARVGQLMLHEGNWDDRQLLSKEAVRQITTDAGTPGICGIGWWSNNSGHYARLPKDAFWGSGAGHQVVLVVPSLNLIAVRNGEVLEPVPAEPSQYHEPLRQFLFEPLVEAISDMTNVPLWGRFETAVTNAWEYANPFADVVLRATLTRPDKSQVPFSGFHDGDGNGGQTGNTWKLRFMPDQVGAWFYECSFSDGAPGESGMFHCVADGAEPGPLRADPANRRCWVFADGSRFSARAYTAPELFVAENETHRKYWIDYFFGTKYKFNLSNANLLNFVSVKELLNWQGTPYKAPDPTQDGKYATIPGNGLFPFLYSGTRPLFDGGSNVDWLRPSVRCWANVDEVLGELEARQVVWFNHWGMIGWNWSGNGSLRVPPAARKPVLRYWIARLAPYWNVTWNIAGEWEEFLTPAELDDLGDFIKEMDPWKHPLTSHALGTTVDRPWVDFRVQQFAAGTSSDSVTNANRASADYANKPVFAFETSWEATPGKLTPDQVRTGAWGSLMGGAFYLYAECFEPTLTWGDGGAFPFVEVMHDFLYGLAYWRLRPDHALANSGSLCLANNGREYVVYRQSGGTITIDLPSAGSAFKSEWLDPRTGAKRAAGTVEGGAKRPFTCPDAHDWVLHLSREDSSTR